MSTRKCLGQVYMQQVMSGVQWDVRSPAWEEAFAEAEKKAKGEEEEEKGAGSGGCGRGGGSEEEEEAQEVRRGEGCEEKEEEGSARRRRRRVLVHVCLIGFQSIGVNVRIQFVAIPTRRDCGASPLARSWMIPSHHRIQVGKIFSQCEGPGGGLIISMPRLWYFFNLSKSL